MKCEVCGDEFIPDGRRKTRCAKKHMRNCLQCGKEFEIKSTTKLTTEYCSRQCVAASTKRSNVCPICGNTFTKRSKTCSKQCSIVLRQQEELKKVKQCELCGEEFSSLSSTAKYCDRDHYANCEVCGREFVRPPERLPRTCSGACQGKLVNTEESLAKRQATSMKRYGTRSPLQSDVVKQKIVDTNVERYGVEYPNQSPSVKAKRSATNVERYGVENVAQNDVVKKKISDTLSSRIVNGTVTPNTISKLNREVAEKFRAKLNRDVQLEVRFGNYYADFAVGDILVDVHPTISHNTYVSFLCTTWSCEQPCSKHKTIDVDYHYKRALVARDMGLSLIQVYDWDDMDEIIATVGEMLRRDKFSTSVVNLNDLNGFGVEATVLENDVPRSVRCDVKRVDGEVSASAVFQVLDEVRNTWRLVTFTSVLSYKAATLFKLIMDEFVKVVCPVEITYIVSFDCHTESLSYLQFTGFTQEVLTGPDSFWYRPRDNKRFSDTVLLEVGADRLLGTSYGSREVSGLDNTGIMFAEGFLPVATAGQRVFVWSS